VTLEPFNMTKK